MTLFISGTLFTLQLQDAVLERLAFTAVLGRTASRPGVGEVSLKRTQRKLIVRQILRHLRHNRWERSRDGERRSGQRKRVVGEEEMLRLEEALQHGRLCSQEHP